MTKVKNTTKKVTLGSAVAKYKNVSVEESVNLFDAKIRIEWEKEIRKAKNAIQEEKEKYKEALIDLSLQKEELEKAYQDAFLNIDESDVESVSKRTSFVTTYERQINTALNNLNAFNSSVDSYVEAHLAFCETKENIIEKYTNFMQDLDKAISNK